MYKSERTFFQKNPFFLFHRHLILLRPIATFPSSQTAIQVALSHVTSFTPSGLSRAGQLDHNADCLTPTGCAHLEIVIIFLAPYKKLQKYNTYSTDL